MKHQFLSSNKSLRYLLQRFIPIHFYESGFESSELNGSEHNPNVTVLFRSRKCYFACNHKFYTPVGLLNQNASLSNCITSHKVVHTESSIKFPLFTKLVKQKPTADAKWLSKQSSYVFVHQQNRCSKLEV